MGWQTRGNRGRRFYYRSERVGQQVRKVYLGRGEAAWQAAAEDAATKAKRAADRAALAEVQAKLAALDQLVDETGHGVNVLVEATLAAMEFHCHRGQWRRRMDVTNTNPDDSDSDDYVPEMPEPHKEAEPQTTKAEPKVEAPKKPNLTPLEATIIVARKGNRRILPILRRKLDEHPELWKHFGDLTIQAREKWLQLIAGKDLYLAETMRLHLDAMRTELAGPNPSPLDRLLVDRILATHVQVLYFEAMETTDPAVENMRLARYRIDRREQAHRQFLSAVKMLATVRNLVARTNFIQVEVVQRPMNMQAPSAKTPACNGVKPLVDMDQVSPATGSTKLMNGYSRLMDRFNGNGNCMAGIMGAEG